MLLIDPKSSSLNEPVLAPISFNASPEASLEGSRLLLWLSSSSPLQDANLELAKVIEDKDDVRLGEVIPREEGAQKDISLLSSEEMKEYLSLIMGCHKYPVVNTATEASAPIVLVRPAAFDLKRQEKDAQRQAREQNQRIKPKDKRLGDLKTKHLPQMCCRK